MIDVTAYCAPRFGKMTFSRYSMKYPLWHCLMFCDDKESLLSRYQCTLNRCKELIYGDKATGVEIWTCQLQEHLCPLLKIFGIVGFVSRFVLRIVSSVASEALYSMVLFTIFNWNMIPDATLGRQRLRTPRACGWCSLWIPLYSLHSKTKNPQQTSHNPQHNKKSKNTNNMTPPKNKGEFNCTSLLATKLCGI